MAFARRSAQGVAEEGEGAAGPGTSGGGMAPSPPLPPRAQQRSEGTGRDDESLSIVFQMTKSAIDLQFSIAERVDSKIRAYFGFAATVYAVAQAIVLKSDVHENLGESAGTVQALAIGATALLVVTMVVTLHALRPHDEEDVSEANLRELLTRGFRGDERAGADGVNLMIGQLNRRKRTNKTRHDRLKLLIVFTAVTAFVAFVEVAVAVEAVT